jgi:hypothetical protein
MREIHKTPFDLAEQIRKDHNGIMGVELFMGHDGHNACALKDYSGEVGKGESGRSLLDAIEKALSNHRLRTLSCNMTFAREQVEDAIKTAIKSFGGPDDDASDRIFNTAGFQQAINSTGYRLHDSDVIELLSNHRQVVRLSGGSHWLLLPHQTYRYQPPATYAGFADSEEKEESTAPMPC